MSASKSANLCWGQRYHWLRYQQVPPETRHEAHIVDSQPLPGGVTPRHIRSLLNHLVRRHEVLRTVYDLDADPWPLQRIEPPGPLTVHEASTEQDGTASPAEVVRLLSTTGFDPARDWPMRACVVTTGGAARRLVLVFNHLAFDDQSLAVLGREIAALLAAVTTGRPAVLPPVPYQPADLAASETRLAGAGTSAGSAALDHWRGVVERLPADMFVSRRTSTPGPQTSYSASLTSPSLLGAAQDIAARRGVWPAAVHLAAYAMTMAAYTGEPLVAHRMYTSQREASGHASVMTCMSFPTMVSVDLGDDPRFSEVVRRTTARVDQSMTHAHVPHDEIVELLAREAARRGQAMRTGSDLNFLSNAPRSCGTRRERFAWNAEPALWARSGADTYLRVYEWSDGVTLMLQATAEVMDPGAIEGFLRGYARLIEVHRDPTADLTAGQAAALLGFAPAAPRAIVRIGPDAVDTAAVQAALRGHPAVRSARVGPSGRGLTAQIESLAPVAPAELRAHVLAAGRDQPGARCPDWFQITGPAGRPPTEGDGRKAPRRAPDTEAEQALAEIVAQVNDLPELDLADDYTSAGGRALRTPRVLARLRDQGWDPIPANRLAGALPLRELAGELVRS